MNIGGFAEDGQIAHRSGGLEHERSARMRACDRVHAGEISLPRRQRVPGRRRRVDAARHTDEVAAPHRARGVRHFVAQEQRHGRGSEPPGRQLHRHPRSPPHSSRPMSPDPPIRGQPRESAPWGGAPAPPGLPVPRDRRFSTRPHATERCLVENARSRGVRRAREEVGRTGRAGHGRAAEARTGTRGITGGRNRGRAREQPPGGRVAPQ